MSLSCEQVQAVWSRRPVYAGVLIGGASARMGKPKPLLRFRGATFIERIVAAVGDRVQRVAFLGDGPAPPMSREVIRLTDVNGLAGPLAGMLAAMRWAPQACWVFIACDLPLLCGDAIDWLLSQRRPDRWAILPRVSQQRVEPLLAVYEPQSLTLLEALAARDLHSPRSLEGHPMVYTPIPPTSLQPCWTNINTPQALAELERDGGISA